MLLHWPHPLSKTVYLFHSFTGTYIIYVIISIYCSTYGCVLMIIIESLLFRMQKLMKTLPTLISHPHLPSPTLISSLPPSSSPPSHPHLQNSSPTATGTSYCTVPMTPIPMTPLPMTPIPMTPLPMTPLPMTPLLMTPLQLQTILTQPHQRPHTPTLPLSLASGFSSIMVMMVLTIAFLYS